MTPIAELRAALSTRRAILALGDGAAFLVLDGIRPDSWILGGYLTEVMAREHADQDRNYIVRAVDIRDGAIRWL